MNSRIATLTLVATTALFTLAACGSDDGSGTTTTSTAPVVTETATASQTPGTSVDKPDPTTPGTTAPSIPPLGNPNQDSKRQAASDAFDLSVKDVRIAEHETFTRVVFDIGGTGQPGWWVDYQDEPTQQASGLPVEVAGDSYLEVNIEGIALPMDAAERGIEMGSFEGAGIVEEVTLTTIFEAQAQFFIGISGAPRDYSVTLLEEPTRVVVDLVH